MATYNFKSNEQLNEIEQQVLNLCIANAEQYGEYNEQGKYTFMPFCYDETDYRSLGLTVRQMKGYVGQLCKKGYIEAEPECYFTHSVVTIQ